MPAGGKFTLITDILFNSRTKWAERYAVTAEGCSITYEQMWRKVGLLAGKLKSKGLQKGDRALVFLPNSPEFLISLFALAYVGSVTVLADIKYNEELKAVFSENDIKWVFTDNTGLQKIAKILDIDNDGACQYMRGTFNVVLKEEFAGIIEDNSFSTEEEPDYSPAGCADDKAIILYTSGSMGQPKGVIYSHRTIEAALRNYLQTVEIYPSDIFIGVTPFFHSYAFGSCMLPCLASGARLLTMESFNPRLVLKTIEQERATMFYGVPYMYHLINQHYIEGKYCLDSLRLCVSAGAPLTEAIAREFHAKTGKIIQQEYGSSETSTVSMNLSDQLELNIASVGTPLKNIQVRIVEDPESEFGIIEVKTPGQCIGYVGKEEFERGWFSMGDIGRIDENNYIYILGRKKRLINIGGVKVNPSEVERCILNHPGVLKTLVQAAKHPDFGEVVEALVVRNFNILRAFYIQDIASHLYFRIFIASL
jgi:long-chain acyl-CoA synthetase